MIFTGIGSRKTPFEIYYKFEDYILRMMDVVGRTDMLIRSGGAEGADSYFESIARKYDIPMDVYLPWETFNYNSNRQLYNHIRYITIKPTVQVTEIAKKHHPNWDDLSDGGKLLHTRNVYQVLGDNLKTLSDVVVCWCPLRNGIPVGGTSQALRIAKDYGIPTLNFWESQ